jgi:hypothetical protein
VSIIVILYVYVPSTAATISRELQRTSFSAVVRLKGPQLVPFTVTDCFILTGILCCMRQLRTDLDWADLDWADGQMGRWADLGV